MESSKVCRQVLSISIAAAILAACSSNGLIGQTPLPGSSVQSQSHSAFGADRSSAAPRYLQVLNFAQDLGGKLQNLAVSDAYGYSYGDVAIFDGQYKRKYSIRIGVHGPEGAVYDGQGNLYVVDRTGVGVAEFAKNGKSPIFRYDSDVVDPIDVAVDNAGNVYVATYGYGYAYSGTILEFPQKKNNPIVECFTGVATTGVAVAQNGVVLVSGDTSQTTGAIVEFVHGLSGCYYPYQITLPVTLQQGGEIKILRDDTVVAADVRASRVDIIPPPWNKISKTINGFSHPFAIALDRKNKLYVTDEVVVDVIGYPSGTLITQLGSADGLVSPDGVATYPSAL